MTIDDHPTVMRYRQTAAARPPRSGGQEFSAARLKALALEAGADDVAVIPPDHPHIGDQREDILRVFPPTRSLVSLAARMNRENIRCLSRDVSDLEFIRSFEGIDAAARRLARLLEAEGVRALSLPSSFPMDMAGWPGRMWPLAHKIVAEAGGLGKMGRHRIVIHPRFGSFVVFATLLVDCHLDVYDKPLDFDPCLQCGLCSAVCPVGAIAPDGHFNFLSCLTHNYRDRLGGFQDWTEKVVVSRSAAEYRRKVSDQETASMWQSLSCGGSNKSSYCLAVCPAGEEAIGPFVEDRRGYVAEVVQPFQDKREAIYVVAGSDADDHVQKRFAHKTIRRVGNGVRAGSVRAFLDSLPLVFQRGQSEGLSAVYHFRFTGDEAKTATVTIKDRRISVQPGHVGAPDLSLTADSRTWVSFLAKEKGLLAALVQRKIRIKGPPRLMKRFARCFPS
jgi:Fe-S-cluster-containing hydrogenase component 2